MGALQEYCQTKALLILTYDFEDVAEGFAVPFRLWLDGECYTSVKKKAKTEAAALLLGALARAVICRV